MNRYARNRYANRYARFCHFLRQVREQVRAESMVSGKVSALSDELVNRLLHTENAPRGTGEQGTGEPTGERSQCHF